MASLKLLFLLFFIIFFIINPNFISLAYATIYSPFSPPIFDITVTDCGLNFSSLPYEPTGECIGHQLNVDLWGILRSKLCCETALSVFAEALSIRLINNLSNSNDDSQSLFLSQDQWNKCNQPFIQSSVSVSSCGFANLFDGSGFKCSSMPLSAFKQLAAYQDALQKCSQVGETLSFDATCGNCNAAISDLLNDLNLDEDDRGEKAGCGVAIVISIAVGRLQNHGDLSNGDFYRCLSASNQFDPGYIKIQYSLARETLAVLIGICVTALIILLIKYVTRSKRKETKPSKGKHASGWSSFYQFSKEEIENAINFDNKKVCLGRGSAGQVFKGVLPSGQIVAIKQIYRSNASDTFEREVNGLMRVKHKNLVSLVGYCMGDNEQYLVYEYCSAGNLAEHLLRKEKLLDWETRVRILRDCADGLRFLHHHTEGCIVHRDIKLTNILLTKDQQYLQPKLSDFGLARMLKIEQSKVFTDVRGTIGYMDPEYMTNAKLTCASDVYSFGIVTLQLLSGQQVFELDLPARDQLIIKAKSVDTGQRLLTDFIDPRLQGDVNRTDFKSILEIAVLCVSRSGKGRPPIGEVLDEMEKALKNTQAWQKAKKGASSSSAAQAQKFEEIPV